VVAHPSEAVVLWTPKYQEELKAAVENVLQRDLIVPLGDQNAGLEEIPTTPELFGWLIQYMQASEKCNHPEPLVDCAEMLVREFSDLDDDDEIPELLYWEDYRGIGDGFADLSTTSPARPYSLTLMRWAGQMYQRLLHDSLPTVDALWKTIEAADLEKSFREKRKGRKVWLMSRRSFEERFGFRVRIELGD
jgi:hypothetical protein